MPTIKDIARLAGVSHGTVSNVLNGRGNVSVKKINAVMDAARQLDYKPNAQARELRAGKGVGVAVVLPDILSERYREFYSGITQAVSLQEEVSLYLTDDQEQNERCILDMLAAKQHRLIISVSCLPDAADYYDLLANDKNDIVFVYRQPVGAKQYVGPNFGQAAQDIAEALAASPARRIGLFSEALRYPHVEQFTDELTERLAQLQPERVLTIYASGQAENYRTAFAFFAAEPFDAIVAMDKEKADALITASALGSERVCPALYVLSSGEQGTRENVYLYQMDAMQLGYDLAEAFLTATPFCMPRLKDNKGFERGLKQPRSDRGSPGQTLNLVSLANPSITALGKLLPGFRQWSGIDVNITTYSYDEMFHLLDNLEQHRDIDVFRVDVAVLPWLASRLMRPLASISEDLTALSRHFAGQSLEKYIFSDDIAYALPFDPSIQLLFYRRDVFEDPVIKRMFYEESGYDLALPENFTDFDAISAFFAKHHQPGDRQRPIGACAVTGNAGLIATEFLLRYYALAGRLMTEEAGPRLEPAIAADALQQYVDQFTHVRELSGGWWSESLTLFDQGGVAMLNVFMNLFNDVAHSASAPSLGYAPVPGKTPLLGGGSFGVSRYSQKDRQISIFFNWLFSRETAEQIALLGGNSAHPAIYDNPRIMRSHPWLRLIGSVGYQGMRESSLPGGKGVNLHQVEWVIGQGVMKCLESELSVSEAVKYINEQLRVAV
ncbi:extracellular solute-binding protein [Serratia marcescens]|uniref:extracellular solute-binding protein n=1 Tax=Serratia marcescens TaxID=615 RepID=UPI0039895236